MVTTPEDFQQLLVGDDRRVEIDLDGLGVVAEVVVCGVGRRAAGVPYPGADDAVDSPELGIRAPESAQAEGGGFRAGGNCGIQGRDLNIRGAPGCLHRSGPFLMAVMAHGLALQGGGVLSLRSDRQAKTQRRRGDNYVKNFSYQVFHIYKIIVISWKFGKGCPEKFFGGGCDTSPAGNRAMYANFIG
jgi:hypothetical protein